MGTDGTTGHKGNTNNCASKHSRNRARSWCFTFNNHTRNDVAHLTQAFGQMGIKKYHFQEEIGESKTPHLQGVVNFQNPIEFNTLKSIGDKIHWERCKNLKASIKYCSKEDTRSGDQWSYGINPTELWQKPIPLMDHQKMLDDMCKQMKGGIPDIVKEWAKAELKEYGDKYKYLN